MQKSQRRVAASDKTAEATADVKMPRAAVILSIDHMSILQPRNGEWGLRAYYSRSIFGFFGDMTCCIVAARNIAGIVER